MNTYFIALEWLEKLMLPCFFKAIFHHDCPGCGLQRSIILLLSGNFWESFQTYWATIPILLMFAVLMLHLKFNYKFGITILIILYSINGILIFCNYFYKLTNQN